jgi:excisionase family DNA binding protein
MNTGMEFLTVTEAAVFLRVRPATIYDWVHRRLIPYRKHGGRLVFFRADLLGWSDNRLSMPLGAGPVRHGASNGIRRGTR